jgi:membrane protease YdiL (CAAX protease family)
MTTEHDPSPHAPQDAHQDDPVGDVIGAWAAALLLSTLAGWWLPEGWRTWGVAASWAAAALAMIAWRHRGQAAQFGLAWRRPLKSLARTGLYAVLVFPPFVLGYLLLFGASGWTMPGIGVIAGAFGYHLAVAALPEELFFRGYAQRRLGDRFGRRSRRVLGVPLSVPLVLAAAGFAVTHLAYEAQPFSLAGAARLLTFFPGLLFGALREDTGDVVAPTLFHAACNALLVTLQAGYGS